MSSCNTHRSILAIAVLISLTVAGTAAAQTAVARKRLGNNVEDITFVGSGRLANSIVTMDGYELHRVPAVGRLYV